ncbi:hypothetical protein N9B39_00215 [bacterium]|nr:hypothetical protein [bacterium]
MNPRQISATVLLFLGIHHGAIVHTTQKEVIPTPAAELFPLFENASGDVSDLAYRINGAFRKIPHAESLTESRKAMRHWVDHSSDITLTFTLDS